MDWYRDVSAGGRPRLVSSIRELFEAQVDRAPGAIALVGADADATYAEVDRRANRIAHSLRARGVRPKDVVGLLMSRDLDYVPAVLGILKAGGVYLPLDPEHPSARLELVTSDGGVGAIVTDRAIDWETSAEIVHVSVARSEEVPATRLAETRVTSEEDGCYVIYTSGSTGAPKGVCVPTRAVVSLVDWTLDEFGLSEADVVVQQTSTSFDPSIIEMFAPLACGAKLLVTGEIERGDPDALLALMERERATILWSVPSFLRHLGASSRYARCTSLRLVFSGGEVLTDELASLLARSGAEIVNVYGPTECAVFVTYWRHRPGAPVCIGRPGPRVSCHVLDDRRQPVPDGETGELYVGGAQVATGYLRRADLTAARFVRDSFSDRAGAMLYRTGDMVRRREDGNLEFVGRTDAQVKIRGFRIELGEVEAALRSLPAVGEAVAIARGDGTEDCGLVAYVTPAPGAPRPSADELRAGLVAILPEHMVPSAFVDLDVLPRNPGGKIDRTRLPPPEVPAPRARYVPPRDPLESALSAIWAEVLRVPRVGVHDPFSALGGHSLLAFQALSRMRQQLSVEISLQQFLRCRTIADLAASLSQHEIANVERT